MPCAFSASAISAEAPGELSTTSNGAPYPHSSSSCASCWRVGRYSTTNAPSNGAARPAMATLPAEEVVSLMTVTPWVSVSGAHSGLAAPRFRCPHQHSECEAHEARHVKQVVGRHHVGLLLNDIAYGGQLIAAKPECLQRSHEKPGAAGCLRHRLRECAVVMCRAVVPPGDAQRGAKCGGQRPQEIRQAGRRREFLVGDARQDRCAQRDEKARQA